MKWAKENLNKCSWIATFPCDTPFFPESIIKSFIKEAEKKESLLLSASSHGRKHNIFGLWSLDLYDKLEDDLINNNIRKVQDWTEKHKINNVEFKFEKYDPFFNINTLDDLEAAKKIIKNEKCDQKTQKYCFKRVFEFLFVAFCFCKNLKKCPPTSQAHPATDESPEAKYQQYSP